MSPFVVFPLLFLALVVVTFALQTESKRELEEKRGWRFRVVLGFMEHYEEKREGVWVAGIIVPCEQIEPGNYQATLPTEKSWQEAPLWASSRKEEILARIHSEHPDFRDRKRLQFS